MSDFEPGFETHFVAYQRVKADDLYGLIRRAQKIGLTLVGEMPAATLPESFRSFASRAPITSEDSYAGREHFATYGERAGVRVETANKLFGMLLNPTSRQRSSLADALLKKYLIEEHGLDVVPRHYVGLDKLPENLLAIDVSNRHTPATNYEAIRVGSVILLAGRQDMLVDKVYRFGPRFQEALTGIVGLMSEDIEIHNITVLESSFGAHRSQNLE